MKDKLKIVVEYIRKNSKFVFPVIICAAMAITVAVALKAGGVRSEELNQIGEPISTTETESETSTTETKEEVTLIKNDNEQIRSLIEVYYNALAEGSEEVLNSICDKVEEKDMIRFLETSKYIEYYPALEIYTKPGFETGDTVAYVYLKVKFTGKDAEYPGCQRLYIRTKEDGSLYIQRTSLPADANSYVQTISTQADVEELENRVLVEFDDLMASQPDLLTYMDEVNSEVTRMVGVKLADKESGASQESGQEPEEPDPIQEGNEEQQQPQEEQSVEPQTEEITYATATTTVNIRKSDSEKAEKIGRVTGGTKVQVLEQLVNGWTKILYEKNEGFIMSKYLKVQESVLSYTAIGTVKAMDNINVRADASTDAAKMGTLVKGETVDLFAVEGEWCKINFKGQVAYVKAEYVERQQTE